VLGDVLDARRGSREPRRASHVCDNYCWAGGRTPPALVRLYDGIMRSFKSGNVQMMHQQVICDGLNSYEWLLMLS